MGYFMQGYITKRQKKSLDRKKAKFLKLKNEMELLEDEMDKILKIPYKEKSNFDENFNNYSRLCEIHKILNNSSFKLKKLEHRIYKQWYLAIHDSCNLPVLKIFVAYWVTTVEEFAYIEFMCTGEELELRKRQTECLKNLDSLYWGSTKSGEDKEKKEKLWKEYHEIDLKLFKFNH